MELSIYGHINFMNIKIAKKEDIEKCVEIEVRETGGDKKILTENLLIELNGKKHIILVAKVAEEIFGFINGKINEWNRSIYIQELFISSSHRGKGLGTSLLNKVKEIGKIKKRRIIFLDLSPNNKEAMDFYTKKGFKKAGEINDFFDNPNDSKAIILSYKL